MLLDTLLWMYKFRPSCNHPTSNTALLSVVTLKPMRTAVDVVTAADSLHQMNASTSVWLGYSTAHKLSHILCVDDRGCHISLHVVD